MTSRRRRVTRLVGLALPAVATLIADPMMGLVDTAVVGRIGAAELGGLGLAVAVLSTVAWVFNFLVYGTTSAVARARGAGDEDGAFRRVRTSVRAALILGCLVGALLWFAAPRLLTGLGAVEALVGPGADYLRVRAIGVPLLLLTFVGHGAFRGASDTRTPLGVAVGANVINAVLTVTLAGPFGIAGVAAATVAAEGVAVIALLVLLPRAGIPRRGLLVARSADGAVVVGREMAELRALLRSGRDLFLRTGALTWGLLAISAAAARISVDTAAAHQLLFQVMLFGAFLLDGLAVAGQATVGTALGRGDHADARAFATTTAWLGAGAGAVVALLLSSTAGVVPRLLTTSPQVLAEVASVWWLLAIGHAVTGVVFALDGVMMGAEDYRYLRDTTLVAAVAGGGAAQWVAAVDGTLLGLWWCVQLLMLIRFVALVLRLRGTRWLSAGAPTDGPSSARSSVADPRGRRRLDTSEW